MDDIVKQLQGLTSKLPHKDHLLIFEAVDMLKFFFGQMQMHSPKIDGNHFYRFNNGYPMTHCIGNNKEDAVKAAIQQKHSENK